MTPERLAEIRERHDEEQVYRDRAGPPFPFNAHVDRGALLAEVDRLRAALEEIVESGEISPRYKGPIDHAARVSALIAEKARRALAGEGTS